MLATVVELDYNVYMMDIQTAFLNADVDEDVFVKMTPRYEHSTSEKSLRISPKPEGLLWYDGLVPRRHRVSPAQV